MLATLEMAGFLLMRHTAGTVANLYGKNVLLRNRGKDVPFRNGSVGSGRRRYDKHGVTMIATNKIVVEFFAVDRSRTMANWTLTKHKISTWPGTMRIDSIASATSVFDPHF